ncbi:MAG: sugar phosphate isomerase/epimerase [Opitutaceae bacterium]|nr:sugar phosphate isomerase/epimerase [Verrucomicrobiales bacterium]
MTTLPLRKVILFLLLGLTQVHSAEPVPSLPPPVPGYPIGRCVKVLGVTTPEEAKQIGFEYLELALQDLLPLTDEAFNKTADRLRAIGLPALSGYGFLPADLKIIGPDLDVVRMDREIRHGLTRAKQLGVKFVVHGNLLGQSRVVPAGFPVEKARAQFVEFARRVAIEAEKHGITMLIQPLPPATVTLINTVADGLELMEAVGRPNLQLLVEYSIFVKSKEDPAILRRAGKQIRQVEMQNPDGWVYPLSADESDYASFIRALKEGGFRGGLSIHGKPGDVFINAPRAITLLRKLVADAASAPIPATPGAPGR